MCRLLKASLLIIITRIVSALSDISDVIPAVRVNCKTPEVMIFQIFEPRVRTLLKVESARQLLLFSEDPQTRHPIPSCSTNYTVGVVPGWSSSLSFLTYGPNSSCTVRSFLIDKDATAHHTHVADIFIKVLSSDDNVGVGRRGRIRLTCTMLAVQQVETTKAELRAEVLSPEFPNTSGPHRDAPLDISFESLAAKLEGSLMLRFFKLLPGSTSPIPAVSINEGEDVYLVASLRNGGAFSFLRPVNCTIRSVISSLIPTRKDAGIREFVHGASRAGTVTREIVILDNGCQSSENTWHMPIPIPGSSSNFRLYFTKFPAPMFSGSLKLNAKCSINLCSEINARACLEQPQPLGPTCFTQTEDIPNFQFQFETFTNITEFIPAILSAPPKTGTLLQDDQAKDDKHVFKRNITADQRTIANLTLNSTGMSLRVLSGVNSSNMLHPEFMPESELVQNISINHEPVHVVHEVKYCFLQRTVTVASVMIVVVLILSIVLVFFSVLTQCKRQKPKEKILEEDSS